jgi:hypothetical protein
MTHSGTRYFDARGNELTKRQALDRRGLLRDGITARYGGITLMDTDTMRSVRRTGGVPARVTDATGRGGTALNMPGFRILDDARGRAAIADARRRYDDDLVNAWRHPVGMGSVPGFETGAGEKGSTGFLGKQREGSPCTRHGWPGVLRRCVDGELYCDIGTADRRVPRYKEEREEDDDDGEYRESEEEIVNNASTHTESSIRRDHRTVAQMMHDHQKKMADIYNKLDHELRETWRQS